MTDSPSTAVEYKLLRAFAPLDKAAFGVAFGVLAAVLLAGITLLAVVLDPTHRFPLHLLAEYFYGYTVTVAGAGVGAVWGFFVGFCWGWFAAFARNVVLAIWLLVVRIKADFATQRDFLDHI